MTKYGITGEQGVVVLIALGLAHELLAQPEQLLSHAFDRWILKHPWTVRTITAVTVLHLLNLLPKAVDPYARIGNTKEIN